MSVMNQLRSKSNGSNGKAWSKEDMRLAIGLKLIGATRKEISIAVGHPVNSITYFFNRKLKTFQRDEAGKIVTEVEVEELTNEDGDVETREVVTKLTRDMNDDEILDLIGCESFDEVTELTKTYLEAQTVHFETETTEAAAE